MLPAEGLQVIRGLPKKDQRIINSIMRELRIPNRPLTQEDADGLTAFGKSMSKNLRRMLVNEMTENGFPVDTIMAVCGVSRWIVYRDMEIIEEDLRKRVDQNWAARKFVSSVHNIERHAKWAENKAETAIAAEDQARFRALALNADKSRAALILKIMEVDVAKRMLEAGNATNPDAEPRSIEDLFEKAARQRIADARAASAALDITPVNTNGNGKQNGYSNGTSD